MALSLKHKDDQGEEVDWQLAKDPNADPKDQEPNDPPHWSMLTDSELDDDWILASGPVVEGVPPDRPTMEEAEKTAGSLADFQRALEIATHAVKATRIVLQRGALNAVFPLEPELNPDDAPADYWNKDKPPAYVCAPESPKYWYDISEGLFNALYLKKIFEAGIGGAVVNRLPRDPLVGIMARYYGAMTVSGGVCSMISAVTAGLATMAAYPVEYTPDINDYTEILVCYHGADHSFCVIGYRDSPWIVADPWVGEPFIIPWEENYFDQPGVKVYQRILVRHRFAMPWNVPILAAAYKREALDAQPAVENFPLTKELILSAERSTGARERPKASAKLKPKTAYMKWRGNHWKEDLTIRTAGDMRFHTDHVWQHLTNHKSFEGGNLGDYQELRKDLKPEVKANQWGREAGIVIEAD